MAGKFPPTAQQQAFLDALLNTSSNLALVARAGCGKTSTIELGVDALAARDPNLEILVCAYNKAIADEVSERLQAAGHRNWRTVNASTLHSMGFGLLKFLFKPTIDDKKVRNLVKLRNDAISQQYGVQIEKLVAYAKQAGFGFFPDKAISNTNAWHAMADHFDVNGLDDTTEADEVVAAAQAVYKASLAQTDVIDFDDMILFPLVKNIRVRFTKDVIFLDEAQDLSAARQALARKFLKPGTGRMIVVGDERQAIYGFSGADADALNNLIGSLRAVSLPLSVTWRCPQSVVRAAQTLVPDIQAAPGAPEGSVTFASDLPDDVVTTDAILCRNTAPLIGIAYKLIRKGIPCKVEGRAIGDGLTSLINRWKCKAAGDLSEIEVLRAHLDEYRNREIQKAMAKDQEAKVEEINDKVETILEICAAVQGQDKHRKQDVIDFIDNLFADGAKGVVTCATYHRAKGREWLRVFLWEHDSRCPSKMAKQEWALIQESNLAYVAITRAKRDLVYVG